MFIAPDEKYKETLFSLWKDVFGDEDGYIRLFFEDIYPYSKVFAHFENGEAVSAFYLLDCEIRYHEKLYSGYYLYAAATALPFRAKGLMSALIRQAQEFCKDDGKDFICLVPANEPLYSYYAKLGFQTAMYKGKSQIAAKSVQSEFTPCTAEEYKSERDGFSGNCFIWNERELRYAFDCFSYYGIHAYKNEHGAVIADENGSFYELICKSGEVQKAAESFSSLTKSDKITYDSPYGEKIPFGMIYSVNSEINVARSEDAIYMNLALD